MNAVETLKTTQKEPETDRNPSCNAVTAAAMQEARDIMSGKIQVKWERPPASKEELKARLREMLEKE
jgi:hypothetical protein